MGGQSDAEIGGAATGIDEPIGVAIDPERDILYVLNEERRKFWSSRTLRVWTETAPPPVPFPGISCRPPPSSSSTQRGSPLCGRSGSGRGPHLHRRQPSRRGSRSQNHHRNQHRPQSAGRLGGRYGPLERMPRRLSVFAQRNPRKGKRSVGATFCRKGRREKIGRE